MPSQDMIKIGIIIDSRKLKAYKKRLTKEGYNVTLEYKRNPFIALSVEADENELKKLENILVELQNERV